MRRTHLALSVAVPALAAAFVTGCGGKSAATTSTAEAGPTVSLGISVHAPGPWKRSISLKLLKGPVPVPFFACGTLNRNVPDQGCDSAPTISLPPGTNLRLEQRPSGPAVKRADSPGWGIVATSDESTLDAVLSSFVAGNRLGRVTYKLTLRRRASGRVVATSNTVTVDWHK
jgi:hypothetical protein